MNGAYFPPSGTSFSKKNRAWRKVIKAGTKTLRRDRLSGTISLSKVNVLTLECGHTVYQPPRTLRPPDRVICKTCEKDTPK